MATTRRRARRPDKDDLTELRHIGGKSEAALNGAGIYTRRDLLAADRDRVMVVLQSTQRLSGEVLDDILAQAAAGLDSGHDADDARREPPDEGDRSFHVFEIEVTAGDGHVVSTSMRHVVGGAPSVWPGFDAVKLRDFVAAAVGLEPDAPVEPEALAPPRFKALGLAFSSDDLVLADSVEGFPVMLQAAGDGPPPIDADDHLDVTVFARPRAEPDRRIEIGSASTPASRIVDEGIAVRCSTPGVGTFGVEALLELRGSQVKVPAEPTANVSWAELVIASADVELVPSPPRLDLVKRRLGALAASA